MKRRKIPRQKEKIEYKSRLIGISMFLIVLVGGMFFGMILPLRPTVSMEEKRNLTKFPKFTVSSFLDGSYFSDISLWYSDTYPMRDGLIVADQRVKSLYGMTPETKIVGGNISGDEIPTVQTEEKEEENETAISTTVTSTVAEADSTMVSGEEKEVRKVEPPDSKQIDQEFQKQVTGGLYIKKDAAYNIYYYVQNSADIYISTLNQVANELAGQTNIYSMLIPNNSRVILSQEELDKMGGSDEVQAIEYYYSRLNENVNTVDAYNILREHNNEYLFFRTDHHWTQIGAYYAYQKFCEKKGITAHSLDYFEKKEYGDFLGSYYFELKGQSPNAAAAMKANPDQVTAYIPKGTNQMKVWKADGSQHDWALIQDAADWNIGAKYDLFLGGDNPLTIIENPNISDGSSCLVLKESYGNVFIPFLVDHYQTVYAVDFRYSDMNILDYVKQHNIQDLILLNNISIVANTTIIDTIHNLLS